MILREDEKRFGNRRAARKFSTDKNLFLICGGRTNFETILLQPGKPMPKKLETKMFGNMERFGISEDCVDVGESGKRIFTTRIYEVQKTSSIRIQADGVDFKVWIPDGSKEREIKPINTKTYDENQMKNM